MTTYAELEKEIRHAGKVLMDYFPGTAGSGTLEVSHKEDESPVSEADYAANEILLAAVASLFPGDGVYSEETPPAEGLFEKERVWIIDPLDGTRSFIHGKEDFSILIGLSVNHVMHYGVMYFPALDLFCRAEKGKGASVNGSPLGVVDGSSFSTDSIYVRNTSIQDERFALQGKMDSGYAFYQLASGGIEGLVIQLTHHREWDYAAPSLIVEEAGGCVSDEAGNTIPYASGTTAVEAVCASHGARHADLLALLEASN